MVLKFKNKESRDQVSNVLIKVKRTHESKMEFEKKVGEVTLRSQQDPIQDDQVFLKRFDYNWIFKYIRWIFKGFIIDFSLKP